MKINISSPQEYMEEMTKIKKTLEWLGCTVVLAQTSLEQEPLLHPQGGTTAIGIGQVRAWTCGFKAAYRALSEQLAQLTKDL